MAKHAPELHFARDGRLAVITLGRPRHGNRFTPEMAVAFSEACERCDDDDVWAVLLRAEGPSFCLGIEGTASAWPRAPGTDFVSALARVRQPVVAGIRGVAEAEGFELALAADLRVVSPRTRLHLPQVSRGTIPSSGGTQRLPRIVGAPRALRAILLGEPFDGREAAACGLAFACERSADAGALRLARAILARGPIALRFAKEAVRRAQDLTLDDGARFEHDLYALLETTADRAEGIAAFLEKRRPVFRGQ